MAPWLFGLSSCGLKKETQHVLVARPAHLL